METGKQIKMNLDTISNKKNKVFQKKIFVADRLLVKSLKLKQIKISVCFCKATQGFVFI